MLKYLKKYRDFMNMIVKYLFKFLILCDASYILKLVNSGEK